MKHITLIGLIMSLSSIAHALPSFQEIDCRNEGTGKEFHAKVIFLEQGKSGAIEAGTMEAFMKKTVNFRNKTTSKVIFDHERFNFEVSHDALYGTIIDSQEIGIKIYADQQGLKTDLETKSIFGKKKTETLACTVFR